MSDASAERARTSVQIAEALALDDAQQRRLAAYARLKFGLDGDEAADVLQETLVEVLRTTHQIRSPRGFVFRVFHLRCCALASRESARRSWEREARPALPSGIPLERSVLLRQGISRVSPSCQRVLRAYYLEGKSLKETARDAALASSSVWKVINRCLERLKTCLR